MATRMPGSRVTTSLPTTSTAVATGPVLPEPSVISGRFAKVKAQLKGLEKRVGKAGIASILAMVANQLYKKVWVEQENVEQRIDLQKRQLLGQGDAARGTLRDEAAKALTSQMQGEAQTAQQAAMQMMMQNPTLQIPQTGTAPRTGVPFRTPI